MNFRLVIQREHPAKCIQIFAPSMENLKQAAEVVLASLPSGAMANLYQTREERIGIVRAERVDGKVCLMPVQEQEEEMGNEAGNEAGGNASK